MHACMHMYACMYVHIVCMYMYVRVYVAMHAWVYVSIHRGGSKRSWGSKNPLPKSYWVNQRNGVMV